MRSRRTAALLLVAAACLAPRPATAQALGIRAFGGYNTYAMEDADDIRRGLFIPPSLYSTPKDGYSVGIGAEWAVRPWLSVTLSYERIVVGRMAEINGQQMKLPANAVLFELEHRRRLRPRIMVGVGAGGGYYQLGEEVESPATARNYEGSSLGGQAFALGEWEMTPAVSFGLDLGYRWAKVDVSKVNATPPPIGIDVDYSGLHTRVVLRYMPRRTR
jgi:hypothetical protein